MERKQFLAMGLAALPLYSFAQAIDPSKPFIVRAGKARYGEPMFYKGKHPNNIVIAKKDTNNAFSVFSYTGYDKTGPSLHLHTDQDEMFFVTEGKYRFRVGEEMMEAEVGDTIFLPRNVQHSWIQLTDKGSMLYAVHPAGTMEEFFIEMSKMRSAPTAEQAKEIHAKHGMKLLGPPMTL